MLQLADTPLGRGLVAKRNIKKGETVLRVEASEILRAPSLEALTELLVKHQGWYLTTLPLDLTHLPVFWSREKVEELPLFAQRMVVERKKQFAGKSAHWMWARSIVGSRNFGDGEDYCLVPLADMMNHSDSPNTSWRFEGGDFVMEAKENIALNEQLFDSYGPKDAVDSLLYYGFASKDLLRYDIVNNGARLRPGSWTFPRRWKPAPVPLGSGEARKINLLVRRLLKKAKVRYRRISAGTGSSGRRSARGGCA